MKKVVGLLSAATGAAGVLALSGVLAGCGGGGKPASSPRPAVKNPATGSSTTASVSGGSPTTASGTSPTSGGQGAENLAVSDSVRSELIAAGAASHGLPASDYTGLVPGETYYAKDRSTATFWAGAGLLPSASSEQAQVSNQDDGAYLIFVRPSGGSWKVYDAGLPASPCPVTVPSAVLKAWGWAPGTCHPPAPGSAGTPTTDTGSLPTVDASPSGGFSTTVKPSTIALSGDSTNIVESLTWSVWNDQQAVGHGTIDILSCVPDCADGSYTPEPVTMTLSSPVGGVFSHLVEAVRGKPPENWTLPVRPGQMASNGA